MGGEMMTDATPLKDLFDQERLSTWLDVHVPQIGSGALEAELIHGGTSNVILSLSRGDSEVILRRPPSVPPPNSEKSILREARVLTALNGSAVPHPHCYGGCDDPAVIGAPFYVMDRMPGWAAELRDGRIYHKAPFDQTPCEYGVAYAMVDGLVALANVDYRAVGLSDFGKPENFLERQVDRWDGQLRSYGQLYGYAGRELPGYAYVRDWLRANVPTSFKAGIIHGDIGTPNALFQDGLPARLSALIDWELSTIGDPLLDLAWFCNGLRDEREPGRISEKALYAAANFPTRQELARYYAAGTGRDITAFDYYLILAMFKSGCILEYKVAQASAGILPKETGDFFSRLVLQGFAEAERLARQLG
jgi:aminoglycoside phosphotransferase (APT) family kinase protein